MGEFALGIFSPPEEFLGGGGEILPCDTGWTDLVESHPLDCDLKRVAAVSS